MSTIKYLFVDGGYLRKALEVISSKYFGGDVVKIDPRQLSHGYKKTFYYDCQSHQRKGESDSDYESRLKEQLDFFERLRETPGVHVIEGTTTGRQRKTRQKQVDVAIAVDMLSHSYRRNMDEATLLSGDLDFKPLVDALVRDGMYVRLWFERSSASRKLVLAADSQLKLDVRSAHGLATADFKSTHPLPKGGHLVKKVRGVLIRTGVTSRNESIRLYQSDGEYHLCVDDPSDGLKEIVTSFTDMDVLETYFRETRCDFEWLD